MSCVMVHVSVGVNVCVCLCMSAYVSVYVISGSNSSSLMNKDSSGWKDGHGWGWPRWWIVEEPGPGEPVGGLFAWSVY